TGVIVGATEPYKGTVGLSDESDDYFSITKKETTTWTTYKNEEYGFEVEHPEDWFVYEPIDEGLCFPASQDSSIIIFSEQSLNLCGFFVHSHPPQNADFTVSVYYGDPWDDIENILEPPKEHLLVAGEPAVMYRFSFQQVLPNINATRIYFNHEGNGYVIFLKNQDAEGTSYHPLYDQILATFKFWE
ncbi:MAG: hypothetical protein ABIC57_03535, partial [bacterium]